jgi:hypothetical protein
MPTAPYLAPSYGAPSYLPPELAGSPPHAAPAGVPGPYGPAGYYPPSYVPRELLGSPVVAPPPARTPPGRARAARWLFWAYAPPPPPPPDDLVDAVEARILALLVPSPLTWFGTGQAPPGQALPYAELGAFDELAEYQSEGEDGSAPYDDRGELPIAVYAGTDSAAKSLGRLVQARLVDAPLAFLDGELLQLRRGRRSGPSLDPDPAPGGGDCWSVQLSFPTITARVT